MANFNKVILLGNLTRDPELRVTTNGHSICKFGLAVSRQFKGQDGSQREETTFVDVDAFGKQAEVISKYCAKGRPLLVEGRLRLDQWDDKQTGQKRSKMGVVLESFQFIGSSGQGGGGARDNQYEASTPPARNEAAQAPSDDIDEDVPF